ncbi:MAG: hypothetical protein FVQ77_04240 [Cytophagales bacterium]|nr:hypothetical protein [Cytophagales bacterium]
MRKDLKRGMLITVNLNPVKGSETGKIRPCIIVTNDIYNARHNFKEHGIDVKDLKVNMGRMIGRKDQVVKEICEGVKFLMKRKISKY